MKFLGVWLMMALSNCATENEPSSASDAQPCGAGEFTSYVGLSIDRLDPANLPEFSRIIHPNTPVTKDYRVERLNVFVDDKGVVRSVRCG